MHITIVIPTYKRIKKLDRCLKSIAESTGDLDISVAVMCDNNDRDTYLHLMKKGYPVPYLMNDHLFVAGCWNYFTSHYIHTIKDSMLWLVDDVELYPDALQKAQECFQKNYPDKDGVVGLSQECPGYPEYSYKPFGQSLLGRKFIERYASVGYQISCPDYTHFYQDEEMYKYAIFHKKFTHCTDAVLKHYHPHFVKEEKDATHNIPRGDVFKKDTKMFEARKAAGLIWGHSFKLLGVTNK